MRLRRSELTYSGVEGRQRARELLGLWELLSPLLHVVGECYGVRLVRSPFVV